MHAGEPVKISGETIHIYPIWMNASYTNTADWAKWVQFEKAFDEAHRGRSSSNDFKENTPFERSRELRDKRRKLAEMRASIAPRKRQKS